jgi:hypothetical protein
MPEKTPEVHFVTSLNIMKAVIWDVVLFGSPILVTLMTEAFLRNAGSYKSHTA